jgi:Bacterial Ig domain
MAGPKNRTIVGAISRLIQRSSAKTPSVRGAYLVLPALLLLSGSQAAHASQCFTNGPRYQLESDTVEWRMQIRSSENCVRGVRFSYVWNATVSLVSPPKSGQVTLMGPGFSYTAKSNFHGEDSFVVGVSGSKKKTKGFSTIRVVVSVVDAQAAVAPAYARFEAN